MKYLHTLLIPFFILALNACNGSSSSSDDDDVDVVSLDTTVDYDIAKALFGTPGVARSFRAWENLDPDGSITSDSIDHRRTLTTLTAIDPAGPCLSGDTQQDSSIIFDAVAGVGFYITYGSSCFSTSGFLQQTFFVDEVSIVSSVSFTYPKNYRFLTTAGDLPLLARIGEGGFFGGWNYYEDTDGNDLYDAAVTDSFTGSQTANWRLEDQEGIAALVLSYVKSDEFGVVTVTKTETYFITPSGDITGFTVETFVEDEIISTVTFTVD